MNLVDALSDLGIESRAQGHHHCRPGWVQIDCPYCGTKDKWHMGISVHTLSANCWRCGRHRLFEVLVEHGASRRNAFQLVKGGIEHDDRPQEIVNKRGKLILPDNLGPLLPAHKKYLKGRGYDPKEMENLWGIKGIGISAELQWRIWIPIHLHGKVVSWTTRAIIDEGLRYQSAKAEQEKINAKDLLYGEDYCRSTVIVHEGPLDVWRTGPGSVATLGIDFSEAQVDRIAKYPVRVICYDSEPAAQRQARKLTFVLEMFPGTTYNVILRGKDASASDPREIRKLRRRFLSGDASWLTQG